MSWKALREYLAAGPKPAEDAVLIIAPVEAMDGSLGQVADALTDGRSRLSLVILAETEVAHAALTSRFPQAEIRHLPLISGNLSSIALVALRVRAALVADWSDLSKMSRKIAKGAQRRGVPVYAFDQDLFTAFSRNAEQIPDLSQPKDIAQQLIRSVGVERLPSFSLDRLAARLSALPLHRLTGGFLEQIDSLEGLRDLLGNPQTVMCLGNGPSGRLPDLAEQHSDVLFRVNHDWRAEGFLDKPDMVFAGVKRSMRKLGPTPLGVATKRKAHALIACRLFEAWHGRVTYAVVDQLAADVIPRVEGRLAPTTGAYMIAMAVALRPERMIVAGMDMFRHPEGAYAGSSGNGEAEINAYTPSHDFDTDAAFLRAVLSNFTGGLVVYSSEFLTLAKSLGDAANFKLIDHTS